MGFEDVVTAIISAVIAFVVPTALKQFWPEPEQVDALPWLKWCVAGFVGGALGGIVSWIQIKFELAINVDVGVCL